MTRTRSDNAHSQARPSLRFAAERRDRAGAQGGETSGGFGDSIDELESAEASAAAASTSSSSNERAWDDVPLRLKVIMLVVVACVGGLMVGTIEAQLGNRIWPLLLGMVVIVGGILALASPWVCRPFERLIAEVDGSMREKRPALLTKLPADRSDEVGRLSRVLRQYSINAAREYHAARQLRRTLDDRVERATRQATAKLEQLAMRDPLTNLGNRRFFEEHLGPLFDSCRSSGTDLIAVNIDMDNFKQVNDTFGHATGDDLLVFLGALLRASVRGEDYAARVGGDEFVILMPGCTRKRAKHFSEQIIALFRQHIRTAIPHDPRPDLSVGIASISTDGVLDGQQLLERADQRLYEAKRAGKGRVAG